MASTTDWKQLPDSVVDPITLEPINELRVEPFKINQHYFDGEALAAYLVASSTFENPLDPELVDWFQRYGINNAVGQLLPVRRGRHRCESLRLLVLYSINALAQSL